MASSRADSNQVGGTKCFRHAVDSNGDRARVSLFGGMERWNGMVEWTTGMEGGMGTPIKIGRS